MQQQGLEAPALPLSDSPAPSSSASSGFIDRYFGVSEKGSTVPREILAGLSTFLALSYIFVVNPAILDNAGINKNVSLFATLVISSAATLAMGLWARLPFVLSTGMEMNAYVAFFVVGASGFVWQDALGMVFWSSVLMLVLTALSVRERIIDAIPDSIKVGLSFSVGVFLVLIALSISGVLSYKGLTLDHFGSVSSPAALALYLSLFLIFVFERLKVPGAVLLSIVATSVLYHFFGPASPPSNTSERFASEMFGGLFQLNFGILLDPRAFSVVLVLFVLDFYGSVAKFIGLTTSTNIVENGRLPRRTRALVVDAGATTGASLLGTTSVITFVESAVGIGAGGRTGLTAVVCALSMLTCFFALPLIQAVPVVATTGALVYVGLKLCPTPERFRAVPTLDKIALASMPLVTIATFAIDKAMLVGFAIYVIGSLLTRGRRTDPYLIGSTALLAISVALQVIA
jgi:AGZA family xanthine/uracil permease-like MFS transporter